MSSPDLFVVCKNCQAEVSPYITECPYCGTRLRKRAPKIDRPDAPAKPPGPEGRIGVRGPRRDAGGRADRPKVRAGRPAGRPGRSPSHGLGKLRSGEIPGISPGRSRLSDGADGRRRCLGGFGTPPLSSFGARLRSRLPQYGHSVM